MKQVNTIVHNLSVYFLALTLLQSVQAQEYIIGVEDVPYQPLFAFKSSSNTHSKELLDSFAAAKGYQFTYLPLPIKRLDKWLIEEAVDFKYPDNASWYANSVLTENLIFSQPTILLISGTSVLKTSLKKSKSEFKSLGTILGFHPTNWLDDITKGKVKLYEDASTKILVQRLIANHIDGIDVEPSVINYYLKELGKPSNTVVIDKRFRYDVYSYRLSTIKYPKIIQEFDDFLLNNKALLNELNKKYNIVDYRDYLK